MHMTYYNLFIIHQDAFKILHVHTSGADKYSLMSLHGFGFDVCAHGQTHN